MPRYRQTAVNLGDGNHLRFIDNLAVVSRRFGGFYGPYDPLKESPSRKLSPEIDGPYVDFRMIGDDVLTSYGKLYRRDKDGKFGVDPILHLPVERDWTSLAVGDFNGDGQPDAALLSYSRTNARLFYNTGNKETPFAPKQHHDIALAELLSKVKKGQSPPLVRDTPVVADWNGDGIDDLVVAFGQGDEVLILLGGKDGLNAKRIARAQLEYRVHYEHGVFVGDFNGDGKKDLAVFGYTNTGVGSGGPPAVYIWQQ
jgi:hypothetical protein